MGLLTTAISLFITILVASGSLELGNTIISYHRQESLIAQLRQVQKAMGSYGGSLCGIAGGTTGFTCPTSSGSNMTLAGLISGGYLPVDFELSPLIVSAPAFSLSGQNFKLVATLAASVYCPGIISHFTDGSCSGNVLSLYAPTVTGSSWALVNSGRFVYP